MCSCKGARPRLSRRHSMENLELMPLTPDKPNARAAYIIFLQSECNCLFLLLTMCYFCLLKGQKWNSDILTKQSKPTLAKSSSKLFFVSRLRGKKYKSGGSSKVLQDTSNTLDNSQTNVQGLQKVYNTQIAWLICFL